MSTKKEPDYAAISRVWDDGSACMDCIYCHTAKEARPYWGVTVYETWRECDILDELVEGDCPGLRVEGGDE